jgi:glutathione S-transferase
MDWQLSVLAGAIRAAYADHVRRGGNIPDPNDVAASRKKTIESMTMLDNQLSKTAYVAGGSFSYGDIPAGITCYRYLQVVPERPALPNLDRWYAAISSRPAFKQHVGSIPLS